MARQKRGADQDGVGIDKSGFRFHADAIEEKFDAECVFFDLQSADQVLNDSSERFRSNRISAYFRQLQSAVEARVDDGWPLAVADGNADQRHAVSRHDSRDHRRPPFRT